MTAGNDDDKELVTLQAFGQLEAVRLEVEQVVLEAKAAAVHCLNCFVKYCGIPSDVNIDDNVNANTVSQLLRNHPIMENFDTVGFFPFNRLVSVFSIFLCLVSTVQQLNTKLSRVERCSISQLWK